MPFCFAKINEQYAVATDHITWSLKWKFQVQESQSRHLRYPHRTSSKRRKSAAKPNYRRLPRSGSEFDRKNELRNMCCKRCDVRSLLNSKERSCDSHTERLVIAEPSVTQARPCRIRSQRGWTHLHPLRTTSPFFQAVAAISVVAELQQFRGNFLPLKICG